MADVMSVEYTDIRQFIDAWIAGDVKSFDDFEPAHTPYARWRYVNRVHQREPGLWYALVAAMKEHQQAIKHERALWREDNQGRDRRDRITWKDHVYGIADGQFRALADDAHALADTRDRAYAIGYQIAQVVNGQRF